MLPSMFRPKALADFIGPARLHAEKIDRLIAAARPTGDAITLLLLGPPGIGKTVLADYFVRQIGASRWSYQKFNGTSFRIDQADEIARSFRLTDMFGGYRVLQIEEVDSVPMVAQVRMLTLLDELPKKCAVVATSNCKIKELEERFQRRFMVFNVKPPSAGDIFAFLRDRCQLAEAMAKQIAELCCGNFAAALKDADEAALG